MAMGRPARRRAKPRRAKNADESVEGLIVSTPSGLLDDDDGSDEQTSKANVMSDSKLMEALSKIVESDDVNDNAKVQAMKLMAQTKGLIRSSSSKSAEDIENDMGMTEEFLEKVYARKGILEDTIYEIAGGINGLRGKRAGKTRAEGEGSGEAGNETEEGRDETPACE